MKPRGNELMFCHKCGTKVVYENTEAQVQKEKPKQPAAGASNVKPFNPLKIIVSLVAFIAIVMLVSSGALSDAFDEWMKLGENLMDYANDTTKMPGMVDSFPGLSGTSATPPPNSSKSSFAWIEDAHIETLDYGIRYIVGTIKNTSNTTFTSASVQFALYDSAGNQIGTTADYISNFKAGNTWKFKAIITSDVAYFEFLHATKVYPKE